MRVPSGDPPRYESYRAAKPFKIDGLLNEAPWNEARSTVEFVDIEGTKFSRPRCATRAWMAWDDNFLFVAAKMDDPNVRASLTERDSVVFHDNDFEVFIDPDADGRNYLEIEVNALNTVFDLLLVKPYREGGAARHEWDAVGLQTEVHMDGTLNDPSDVDEGWTVEMAIPWRAICEYTVSRCPPRAGDVWRMNFSLVQWPDTMRGGSRELVGKGIEDNWVWSPQGEVDMHIPQRWGLIEFVGEKGAPPND